MHSLPAQLKVYGGSIKKQLRWAEKDNKLWSAFNPSIAKNPNGEIAMVIRSSNYILGPMQLYTSLTTGQDIINHVWFAELDDELNITSMNKLEVVGELSFKRGIEDARLFWRDGAWHMTAVILENGHTPIARIGLFRLELNTLTAHFIEKYEGPDKNRVEKNWSVVAGESVPEFDLIYGPNAIYKNGKVKQLKAAGKYKNLRGGTQLIPWEDGYLSVWHITRKKITKVFNSRTFSNESPDLRDYTHVFVTHGRDGSIEKVSEEFIFGSGAVEFAAGIIKHDGKLVISWGHDDAWSWLATISVESVKDMLH
jgi:predicted GH43/DUF377 family glycosyl hydrolase